MRAAVSWNQMPNTETATLGGGCFWCLEAVFQQMEGILSVESGYMGGHVDNPTYEQVCTRATGHIEVVQLTFDPGVASFRDILEVFFAIHDPTTKDRQGNDVGPQYRSAIFYHSEAQREIAEETIRQLDAPVVTEVRPATTFYRAEEYHQEYFLNNPQKPYCAFVVAPKVEKFRKKFMEKLKRGIGERD
jgi:peptide-methionine (S)-S-oxide reductase